MSKAPFSAQAFQVFMRFWSHREFQKNSFQTFSHKKEASVFYLIRNYPHFSYINLSSVEN